MTKEHRLVLQEPATLVLARTKGKAQNVVRHEVATTVLHALQVAAQKRLAQLAHLVVELALLEPARARALDALEHWGGSDRSRQTAPG